MTMARPGWYPDPDDERRSRYFDGGGWHPHVRVDGVERPLWEPLSAAQAAPGEDVSVPPTSPAERRKLLVVVAVVAVVVVMSLGAVAALSDKAADPVAAVSACDTFETIVQGRRGAPPVSGRDPRDMLPGVPAGWETQDVDGGTGSTGPGRPWEGSELAGADALVQWAARVATPPAGAEITVWDQLVQEFANPSAAVAYETASLRELCQRDGVAVRAVPAVSGAVVVEGSDLAQVSVLRGQYRLVLLAEGPGASEAVLRPPLAEALAAFDRTDAPPTGRRIGG